MVVFNGVCMLAHQLAKRAAEVGLQWVTVGYALLLDFSLAWSGSC
jgi:hypothetical protein